jgi:hypothetical protein
MEMGKNDLRRWALQPPPFKGLGLSNPTEVIALPAYINQLEKTKKKEKYMDKPAEPTHGPAEPIHALPPLPTPAGSGHHSHHRRWIHC